MSHSEHNPADKPGAIAGFFLGAVAILAIVVTITLLTNSHYAGEGGEKPAAEASK
ncbi:MAG: hypothetical protein HY275_15610 [Gemmatimonadetes bacterium]|nr:hypothetical protein [Gemmatimonadota bacterium]